MSAAVSESSTTVERQQMAVDIACVGFGPAMGGFLTTLSRSLLNAEGTPRFESASLPGVPLQVVCYERADGLGFGVSGVVTRARGIRESFPGLDFAEIPMAVPVKTEKLVYLLDPGKASRRSLVLRAADRCIRAFSGLFSLRDEGIELPFIPGFMTKQDGLVLSIGQFNLWVGEQLTSSGLVQIWPSTPVSGALIENDGVNGVRLADQGTELDGSPAEGFMPGMDVRAALTVIGDGPVGAVGRGIDAHFGLPQGHGIREWALGMKMVIELREDCRLEPGMVLHTLGYPEPEIFGFLYVHPNRLVSVGIFIPSWFRNPARTSYRYLQHFIQHPYLWRHLEGGTLKSWGAKSLQESGRHGEPFLVGNGYARIGEGSGSTNVLAGSGVDEAWATGTQLAEAVLDLLEEKKAFTRENLRNAYVRRRRASWVDQESRVACDSRNGFPYGLIPGLLGMAIAGVSRGKVVIPARRPSPNKVTPSLKEIYGGRIPQAELKGMAEDAIAGGLPLHDQIMNRLGWPEVPYDGKLLVSQQDALLMGGSVQAPPGYANHVVFVRPEVCRECEPKLCVEMCSGQAITRGRDGLPNFDREKCVYCGACLWNCRAEIGGELSNVDFRAGAGGLHSALN
jgi:electron-transferring-flavoprotein dehydrogenase